MAMRVCPKCQSNRLVNNGSTAGKPKKLCQQCGDQVRRENGNDDTRLKRGR
jgi:transposase-like protein